MASEPNAWTPDFGALGRAAPAWDARRPVRIAVLGDFSAGSAAGRLARGAELAARKPIAIEADSIDAAMARLAPKPRFALADGDSAAGIEIAAGSLDDLHPDALYAALPVFGRLADLRRRLLAPATFAAAAAEVRAMAGNALPGPAQAHRPRARGSVLAPDARLSDFARLTGRVPAGAGSANSVDAWLRSVVAPFVVPAADPLKDALVASVDAALSAAMRSVLHHPDFQAHESLWRGLDFLARRVETGPDLQLWLFDVSAEEFAADLSQAGDLGDSALYEWFVTRPAAERGGGYAMACACFGFDASPPHAELLGRAASIFEHAGAALVSGLRADAFADARRPPHPLIAQAFSALRKLPQASHLALATPHFMLRHPYGRKSDPIRSFAFEEFTPQAGLASMLWGHPAIAVAALAADPSGHPAAVLGDLPFHHVRDADGDPVALPCTDRLYPSDVAALLGRRGLMPLIGRKGVPELRIARVVALDGSPIELGAPRPARPRSDVAVAVGVAPRGAGNASSAGETPAADASAPADGALSDPSGATESGGSGGTSDLDALLAGLGAGQESPAPAGDAQVPDGGASGDAAAPANAAAAGGIDADLARLLGNS